MPTSTKEPSVNIAALDEILSKRARVEPLAEPRLLPVGKAVSDARPKHIRVGRLRPERVDPIQSDSSSFGDWGHYLLLVAALLLGAYSLTLCLPTSSRRTPQSSLASPAATASAKPRFEIVSRPIETIEPFERIAGRNPQVSDEDRLEFTEPDPQSWRVLRLEMTKSNGRPLRIKLARPVEWIEAAGAVEGGSFFLDLPEMGAVGHARVVAVEPAPRLESGPGNIVTGVFEHEADESIRILSLDFSNGAKIHGVTSNHPFWSETHQMFVPVGDLREGDRVRGRDGTTSIVSIRERSASPGEKLYNLEVYGEHVYEVTESGIVVHNICTSLIHNHPGLVRHAEDAGRSVQRSLDGLTAALNRGNMNPGIGSRHLFNGVMEARARDGARVYFRNAGDHVEILAKSSKHNQNQVINLLRQLYGN